MRRTTILFTIVIGVTSWTNNAGGWQANAGTLSATLRAHVQDERFATEVTAVRGLPLGVRDGLQALFGSASLDIANPGAEIQINVKVVKPAIPTRRLVLAGCSMDHCLVYYERGGADHSWRVALFHWTPAETRFEFGGIAPGALKSIGEVQKAILSGAIKDPGTSW